MAEPHDLTGHHWYVDDNDFFVGCCPVCGYMDTECTGSYTSMFAIIAIHEFSCPNCKSKYHFQYGIEEVVVDKDERPNKED